LVTIPAIIFGVKIQVDTGLGISPSDAPRMAVWQIGWFELFGMFFEPIISLFNAKSLNLASLQTHSVVTKLVSVQFLNFVGINIRMANNISGMLSSSFQPTN
jgi:hypothetical protein